MNRAVDVNSLDIELYTDKTVKQFSELIADPEGKLWLSNSSAEVAAMAMSLAVRAIRKTKSEDADVKQAERFIDVMRKFFLKTVDQDLQSRAEWDKEAAAGASRAAMEGGVFAACSEIDEILYGMIKALDMLDGISAKLTPESCADAAAAVLFGKSAMEAVKLQRYYYASLITGDVNVLAMRREPEIAIENTAERYDALYDRLVKAIG